MIRIGHLRLRFAGPRTGAGNFVPFKTLAAQIMEPGNHMISAVNLIGNTVPFMSIGLLVPLVFPSTSWLRALGLGVLTGRTFEVMEIAFRVGIFDVDDIMLNSLGVLAGYGAFIVFARSARSS